MPRVEQQPVALDDARDLGLRVEAGGRRAVRVRRQRARAVQHRQSVAPCAQPPLGVLPVERVVAAALGRVASQRGRAEQRGAAARAQVGPRFGRRGHRRVVEPDAAAVDVPVGEARFLAAAVGAALEDLRRDREHAGRAQRQHFGDGVRRERHVVVEQIRAVVARDREPAHDRGGERERRLRVHPLDVRESARRRRRRSRAARRSRRRSPAAVRRSGRARRGAPRACRRASAARRARER